MRLTAPTVLALSLVAAVACNRDTPHRTAISDSAIVTPATRAAAKTNYVGLQYDSLPRDFTYQSGAVLPAQPGRPGAEYDLAHVMTPSGEMIWLDTLGARVGRGLRAKIVRAELMVPQVARDERLFIASCDADGKLDPRVVAIVVNQAATPGVSRFTQIRQAWRVNIAAARFDIIPVKGIVCEDPGT